MRSSNTRGAVLFAALAVQPDFDKREGIASMGATKQNSLDSHTAFHDAFEATLERHGGITAAKSVGWRAARECRKSFLLPLRNTFTYLACINLLRANGRRPRSAKA